MYFDEADIKQLGIRNSAHRARIVSSLVALRDKHRRGPGKFVRYYYMQTCMMTEFKVNDRQHYVVCKNKMC